MTIRFAASAGSSCLDRYLRMTLPPPPANDHDIPQVTGPKRAGNDNMLTLAALRHFGVHGLAAGREARRSAEKALATDDHDGFEFWLAICRQLDRAEAVNCVRAMERRMRR